MKITSKQLNEFFKEEPRLRELYHNNTIFKMFCDFIMFDKGYPDRDVLSFIYDLCCRIEKLETDVLDLRKDKPIQYVFQCAKQRDDG